METKYDRIQRVKNLGFNTEESILISPGDKYQARVNKFLKNYSQASVRTFRDDQKGTPAHPIVEKNEIYKLTDKLTSEGYSVIIGTPIDPKDCEFAGAARKTESDLVLELAIGPGTVRRVTHQNIIDRRVSVDLKHGLRHHYMTDDNRINEVVRKLRNSELNNVIYEFSWYKQQVGHKKENFIVWEVTDDGTGKSRF